LQKAQLNRPRIADIDDRYNPQNVSEQILFTIKVCNGRQNTDLAGAFVAGSQLATLLYTSKITDLDEYHKEIENVLNRLLYWLNIVCPGRVKRSYKLHLLYHLFSDSDLYGPVRQCSTETQEGQNKIIRKAIQRTTGINQSKDIHVQTQKNLAYRLKENGLYCFKSGSDSSIIQVRQQIPTK
jgi:hypothetical protein